jgi:hypothetical protein
MTKKQLDAIREAISFDDVQLQHAVDLMAEVQLLNEENTVLLAVNEGEPWAWQVLVKQRDEAKEHLSNLLARIFRDGAHYETQNGTNTAVVAADRFLVELFREVDEGFKRGAETMREQCALLFDGGDGIPGLAKIHGYRDFIRQLPLPRE